MSILGLHHVTVAYFERAGEARVTHGPGQAEHYALAVAGDDELREWREKLLSAGLTVSAIEDRVHFKSFFTHDPDGQAIELATSGPGFVAGSGGEVGRQ